MNEIAMKGLMKMAKNFISPDQIKAAASSLMKTALDYKSLIPLEPDKGEVEATAIFYEVEGKIFFAIGILSEDNQIVRFENVQPLDNLIDSLISKI